MVYLQSSVAAFRLQFVQKFLKGSADLVWRMMAKTILQRVKGLGMDAALFLVWMLHHS